MTEENKVYSSALAKINDTYLPQIEQQMEGNRIEFSDYARKCVMNAIGDINQLLDKEGLTFRDSSLDQSNITNILLNVAHLELNPLAQPSECYFIVRKTRKKDGTYKHMIEMGIEGDGNDAILARFGRDVQKVYPHWLVREGDYFKYPTYNGLEMTPPEWSPTGQGDVVRIVYPILHTDNTLHYYIGEREDVKRNLLAHINNNLMNETFGICENRYKATADQLKKITTKKNEIKKKARELGFDAINDPELEQYISPAWKEDYASESMIIRKIRNNIVNKIPKHFGSAVIRESYDEVTVAGYYDSKKEREDSIAVIDVEPISVPESEESVGNRGEGSLNNESPSQGKIEVTDADIQNREKPSFD